ncbi:MAG: FecR family protein, partial [Mangrovibacterium sp.]
MNKQQTKLWELLAAKQHHQLSIDDEAELQRLRAAFPNEESAADQIGKGLHALQQSGIPKPAQSWRFIRKNIQKQQIRRVVLVSGKYAAIVILSLLVGYFVRQKPTGSKPLQYAEMEVQYGQTGHLYLFDGTEVWLNSGSKLKYPNQFNSENRTIELEGEAYFKVTRNAQLPFKVKTKAMEVEVLGTSFNVSAYNDDTKVDVVLEEGKVKLNQLNGTEIGVLKPGEQASLDTESRQMTVARINTKLYTNWKDGRLEFKGEPLGEVARKLERWYNVSIRID